MVRLCRVRLPACSMCPPVIRSRSLRGHHGDNILKYQECCERLRALPLKAMECVIFGKWPGVIRFSLAICPRACSLSHVMLSVQEYGRLPSVNRGTSLRGTTAGRGREGLGKKNQSLKVSYDRNAYHLPRPEPT